MRKEKPSRDVLYQYAYDFGLERACELLKIDEDTFWKYLYPPIAQVNFPTYAKKETPFNPVLSDIIATSYALLKRKLITPFRDDISQEDTLQDAIVIAMQEFGLIEAPDQNKVRDFIIKKHKEIEYFLKINRSKFNSDEI